MMWSNLRYHIMTVVSASERDPKLRYIFYVISPFIYTALDIEHLWLPLYCKLASYQDIRLFYLRIAIDMIHENGFDKTYISFFDVENVRATMDTYDMWAMSTEYSIIQSQITCNELAKVNLVLKCLRSVSSAIILKAADQR